MYFASRTHSQLRQLTAELLKTKFAAGKGEDGEEGENGQGGMSLVPLASRRQMCINDRVRSLRGETQINEACLDMQKGGSGSTQRCEFLPPKSDEGTLLDARDSVLATVRDIEDLVTEGRASKVCPYYSTRRAVKSAQLVTLPYNLLLQKSAREALGIDLTDQIVVIDEAHSGYLLTTYADQNRPHRHGSRHLLQHVACIAHPRRGVAAHAVPRTLSHTPQGP